MSSRTWLSVRLATAIETLVWGWAGLIATGIGGLLLLGLLVLSPRAPAGRAMSA